MADLKQYGVLVVGLLMAGGFAFGGMASYSSMIDSGPTGDDELEAQLPEKNFIDGDYNLSTRERMYLTIQEDVVFISAVYNTSEQKQQLMQLENMTENFKGRVYLSVENASTSTTASAYTLSRYPNVLMYGYTTSARQQPTPAQVEDITESNIASTVCRMMNEWGDVRAYCARV